MISILSLEEKTTKHSLLPSLSHPTTWGCFYKAVICKPRTKPSWETRLASILIGCSPVVLVVKNQPANAGDIRNTGLILGGEDPLAEGIATHSSILARKIPWSEDPDGLQSVRSHRVRHEWSDLAQNLNSHLNLQNCEKIHFYCVSHTTCAILLCYCKLTNMPCFPVSPSSWTS